MPSRPTCGRPRWMGPRTASLRAEFGRADRGPRPVVEGRPSHRSMLGVPTLPREPTLAGVEAQVGGKGGRLTIINMRGGE